MAGKVTIGLALHCLFFTLKWFFLQFCKGMWHSLPYNCGSSFIEIKICMSYMLHELHQLH